VNHSTTPGGSDAPLTATDLAARPLGGSRVLVLESDHDGAASLVAVLRLSGFDAEEAHSGAEALRVAAKTRPCAVLMELDLPDADALRVIRQFRASAHPPAVVIVTGVTSPAARAAATAAGAAAYLLKPADPQALVGLVQRLCHPA
jgi:DNA-binding response OmpR family regulator